MDLQQFDVVKSSGEIVRFSVDKLQNSLRRSGADEDTVQMITDSVSNELYPGISTKEIYNRAFSLLKKRKSVFASRYKLKKAIYELGPTGFPFERFIGAVLKYSGYKTSIGITVKGKCVDHEVDVLAQKDGDHLMVECKFHGDHKNKCDVKIPLYIHSRYKDILSYYAKKNKEHPYPNQGWLVTNTRFTRDAMLYGKCAGLYLMSWDYPEKDSLKDRIDRLGLYPITVSTLLTAREKQFLLSRDVVLCRELLNDKFYLDHLGVGASRKERIVVEIKALCNI